MSANGPRRADALDILVRTRIDAGEFDEAVLPANEVVRLRRIQRPVDYELLAMALGLQGTVLFALDRAAGADRVFRAQLDTFRRAYPATDLAATGTANIHVIAHSMGNRVLQPALVKVAANPVSPLRGRLAKSFSPRPRCPSGTSPRGSTAPYAMARRASRYMRRRWTKQCYAGYVVEWGTVLAGHATSGEPLLHGKVESIDISEAGTSGLFDLNHDVFASNPVMSEDMRQLLQTGQRPPSKRIDALVERKGKQSGAVYWH